MRRNVLFKIALLLTLILFADVYVSGQAILPFSYDGGNPGTTIAGLTQSGLGANYSTSPKMKFDTSGDYLILNFSGVAGVLSFNIKWNQGSTLTRFPGIFSLQQSADGVNYSTVQLYNSTTGTALPNAKVITEVFTDLLPTSHYLKWTYSSKSNGNIGIGAISLSAGVNAIVTSSTSALSGFTYITGSGPSAEQSFTISGNSLYDTLTLVPPGDYEISTAAGAQFVPMNPVKLIQTGGIVAVTPIYVRLKQGLAVGKYAESITCSTVGATSTAITCTGNVTSVPTITLTDITDPVLNAVNEKPVSESLNVSGVNLSTNVGLAVTGTDAGLFSLSQYSVAETGGTVANTVVTITYSPAVIGSNSAILTVTSNGAMAVSRTLNGISSSVTDAGTPTSQLFVYAENGSIVFRGSSAETVEIYNAIGQKVLQKRTTEGVNTIPVAVHGVLFVKVGSRVTKLIL